MSAKALAPAPEWARARHIAQQFGLGRSTLYRLALEGRIETKLVIGRGAKKGTRLYLIESIRELLAKSRF